MEPPGEGRYEVTGGGDAGQRHEPQWSRPVKGGTSPTPGHAPNRSRAPQWSRPVKGGTRIFNVCSRITSPSRNGAAR